MLYVNKYQFYKEYFLFFRLCKKLNNKQFVSKWLSDINQSNNLLNDTLFSFYLGGLYLSKICERSQQQIILKLLNKKILLPLISYAVDLETNYNNRFDLMKIIPTAACIPVRSLLVDDLFTFKYNRKIPLIKINIYKTNKNKPF